MADSLRVTKANTNPQDAQGYAFVRDLNSLFIDMYVSVKRDGNIVHYKTDDF